MSASHDNTFDTTNHQFKFQNTAIIPFSQLISFQRGLPSYYSFTRNLSNFKNYSTVTNQSNKSIVIIFNLSAITTIVPVLPSLRLRPLNIADTYSLSSTIKNLFRKTLF